MATDLITLAEGAALSQFLGPFGKALGEVALKQAQQLGERAVGYLKAVAYTPMMLLLLSRRLRSTWAIRLAKP
jgi:hypothetical protein